MVFCPVLFGILFVLSAVSIHASPTEQLTLKNGMHVVVRRDTRSPVALVSLWYHVGSANEHNGITGISHLLEHMMFRGTHNVPDGDFSKQIIVHGGRVNAFTSRDNTAYVDEVAVSQIPLVLKLEADRMQHLVLDPQAFLTEQKVVLEERHARVTDQPLALLAERYQAASQTENPCQHPIVGWLADIQQLTTNDLYTWYYRWYQPSHTTLVVVGDVKPSLVFKQAQDIFGGIMSHGQQSERKQFPLLPALGEKTVLVRRVSGVSAVLVGFNVPTVVTAKHAWQPYALEMLAYLAAGNHYGWLYQDLVYHQKLAAGVRVHYTPFAQYNTLWSVEAVPMHGVPLAKLKKALLADLQLLAGQVSDPLRLQIAYTDIRAEHIYAQDTLSGQANWLGILHANNVKMTLQSYLQQLHKVTPAHLHLQTLCKVPYRLEAASWLSGVLSEPTFAQAGLTALKGKWVTMMQYRAKQALIGHFPLALASNAGLSHALVRMAFYHLPMTYLANYQKNIQAVTLAQAKAALAVLHLHRLLTVQVGG